MEHCFSWETLISGATEEGAATGVHNGKLYFAVSTDDHPTLDYYYFTCSLADYIDVWVNLVLTYDGTATKMWVDGRDCGQVLMTGDIKWPSQASWLTVGAYKDVNEEFPIKMDLMDLAFYRYVIPATVEGCDPSQWVDVDHGTVCGPCSALADNMGFYDTCDAYCAAQGLQCVDAWEELEDTCTILFHVDDQPCSFSFAGIGTSDAICECEPDSTVAPTASPAPTSECDPAHWVDVDHDLVCGPCSALADNMHSYDTCNQYCTAQGLVSGSAPLRIPTSTPTLTSTTTPTSTLTLTLTPTVLRKRLGGDRRHLQDQVRRHMYDLVRVVHLRRHL